MASNSKKKVLLIDRDISWMYFNRRILLEAKRSDVPLLERVNFLGIYSNNLDEFFRVRVASLRRIIDAEEEVSYAKRAEAEKVLKEVYRLNKLFADEYEETLQEVFALLAQEHIRIVNETELNAEQKQFVFRYFMRNLSTVTIPLFLRKMNFASDQLDETIYLAVNLEEVDKDGEVVRKDVALIKQPDSKSGRFVCLPHDEAGNHCIMFIEDLIRYNLPYIFSGLPFNRYEAYAFKFTKDAEMDLSEDVESGVLQKVTRGLKKRRKGEMLRIVYDSKLPRQILRKLFAKADIGRSDARIAGGRYHNTRDLMKLPSCGRNDLCYAPQPPLLGRASNFSGSTIEAIFKKDIGLHFPFHSFDRVLWLLREAAISDAVKEIKITLYRVASSSQVVNALIAAAKNGKKVTAVIELLARFDEESNISWSKQMTDAGINVVFGPENVKIHSKLIHITTRYGNIACIGTGNLHEGTAKVYTDFMLLTHHRLIVNEVANVFKFIEKPFLDTNFKELLVSPNDMRKRIVALINREIRNKLNGRPAYIKIKINHITDKQIITKLYAASQVGVEVELLVRGNCSVVPEVKGMSENIKINAIIDRYLEHSRILIFCNNNDPVYYIGSADWMERNLDRRIEVMAPIYDPEIQRQLELIVESGLQDVSQGHYVNTRDGEPRRYHSEQPWYRSQQDLYRYYSQQEQED